MRARDRDRGRRRSSIYRVNCKLLRRRHQQFMETSERERLIIEDYSSRKSSLLSQTHPVKPLHIDFHFMAYSANCFRKAIADRAVAL